MEFDFYFILILWIFVYLAATFLDTALNYVFVNSDIIKTINYILLLKQNLQANQK